MDEYKLTTKSSNQLSVPLENKKNPYDKVGEKHNLILDFISSQIKASSIDLCEFTKLVQNEFPGGEHFDCNDITNAVESGLPLTFDDNNDYKSDLYDTLLANNKISLNVRNILNSTTIAVFNANNVNQKVALLKAAENFTRNFPHISEESRKRILVSFAIYRYSTYYWEIDIADKIDLACPECVSLADDMAFVWALSDVNEGNAINDWDNGVGFSSLVSAVVGRINGW